MCPDLGLESMTTLKTLMLCSVGEEMVPGVPYSKHWSAGTFEHVPPAAIWEVLWLLSKWRWKGQWGCSVVFCWVLVKAASPTDKLNLSLCKVLLDGRAEASRWRGGGPALCKVLIGRILWGKICISVWQRKQEDQLHHQEKNSAVKLDKLSGDRAKQGHPPAYAAAQVMCAHVTPVRGNWGKVLPTSHMRNSKAMMGSQAKSALEGSLDFQRLPQKPGFKLLTSLCHRVCDTFSFPHSFIHVLIYSRHPER